MKAQLPIVICAHRHGYMDIGISASKQKTQRTDGHEHIATGISASKQMTLIDRRASLTPVAISPAILVQTFKATLVHLQARGRVLS